MKTITFLLLLTVLLGCGGTQDPRAVLERFKRITSGMSATEVTKIMGPPVRTVEEGQTPDGKRKYVYHWVGSDGIEYSAWFEGSTVGPTRWQVPMQRP